MQAKRGSGGSSSSKDSDPSSALCFSIVTAERTLDLEADDPKTRDKWVAGIEALVLAAVGGGNNNNNNSGSSGSGGGGNIFSTALQSPSKRSSSVGNETEAGAAPGEQQLRSPSKSPGKRGSRETASSLATTTTAAADDARKGGGGGGGVDDFNDKLAEKRRALELKQEEKEAAFNKNKAGRDKLRDMRSRASSVGKKD